MITVTCDNCGEDITRMYPYMVKGDNYCNSRCQMHHEYKTGMRDKNKITEKARKVSHKKLKENNWLNSISSRLKLKAVQQTKEYKLKCRLAKLGEQNPMYRAKPWNYVGIDVRDKYGNADRGFDWKTIKKRIKKRDDYCCRECGISEKDTKQYLQVHHLVKYSISQDSSDDNLITLCPKCHADYETQFIRVSGIRKINEEVEVYNFSVLNDESYVADNFIVHNCRSRVIYLQE